MKYAIHLQQDENNLHYQVNVPDLPGCSTTSKTIDLAIEDIKKVVEQHLSILAEYGEKIPTAAGIEQHQKRLPVGIWALVDIDISPYLGKSHKINVTLPELLIKQIDDRVSKSEHYKTRSGFIAAACLAQLEKT